MRTISACSVSRILVMTNLRTHTGMDLALSQGQLAAPCQAGSPTRMSIPALGVDAPIERIGLDHRAQPDDSVQAPLARRWTNARPVGTPPARSLGQAWAPC